MKKSLLFFSCFICIIVLLGQDTLNADLSPIVNENNLKLKESINDHAAEINLIKKEQELYDKKINFWVGLVSIVLGVIGVVGVVISIWSFVQQRQVNRLSGFVDKINQRLIETEGWKINLRANTNIIVVHPNNYNVEETIELILNKSNFKSIKYRSIDENNLAKLQTEAEIIIIEDSNNVFKLEENSELSKLIQTIIDKTGGPYLLYYGKGQLNKKHYKLNFAQNTATFYANLMNLIKVRDIIEHETTN